MAWLVENLRDCQAWKESNLELSTTSNQAARLYDAAIRQYVSWMESDQLGGFGNTLEKIYESDPNFVMGRSLEISLEFLSTKRRLETDKELAEKFEVWKDLVENSKLKWREREHVNAVMYLSKGDFHAAAECWERILKECPWDILALKHAQNAYIFTGDSESLRDSPLRVWPHWKKSMPLYGHVEGILAFGFEEMCQFSQAECHAKQALEVNRQDAWATHALVHVMHMQARLDEGIRFMEETCENWTPCCRLAGHNFWHLAVLHLEKLDYESPLQIFDEEILNRTVEYGGILDIANATSLLYRLQLEEVDVGDRWEKVFQICRPLLSTHVISFNDAHFLMSFLNSKNEKDCVIEEFMESLKSFIKNVQSPSSSDVAESVGLALCQGMIAYDKKDYRTAAEFLCPVADRIFSVGGSHAQRDVFVQLLIRACMKSPVTEHKKKAGEFLMKRQKMMTDTPLIDRLSSYVLRSAQSSQA